MEPQRINWCCGEHSFRLRIGEAEALDDATKDGISDFLWRLQIGRDRIPAGQEYGSLMFSPVRVREVIDCIRLGLIGGGMDAEQARKLAIRGFDEAEFSELVMVCYTVIRLCLSGKEHDQPEKPEAAVAAKTSGSGSRRSTGTARSSATRRNKSKK